MTLYLVIAAAILVVSTAVTFSSKAVSNQHLLVHLILFPVVYLLCGLPAGQIAMHFLAAALLFVVGFLAFIFLKIGGGTARALVIAALWIPGLGLFFDYLTTTLIVIGAMCVMAYMINKSDRFDHFATLVFACCSAFLFYQYNNQPTSSGHDLAAVQKIENVELPVLRGLNSFKLK